MIKEDELETQAFFYKMAADYYRYWLENYAGKKKDELMALCDEYYTKALGKVNDPKYKCDPIKLGATLNYSVHLYEVKEAKKEALKVAEKGLQEALEKIDDVDEETYRDAKTIIELLKENISLWKEEEDEVALDDL